MTRILSHHTETTPTADARQIPTRGWTAALLILLLIGAAFRVRTYQARASYWSDEAFIVLNITDLPARQLMGPLLHKQAAPTVFLWIEKGMAGAFGTGEYSLRLLPLMCGLASMGLFAVLAHRLFSLPAAVAAVGLFACCEKLIQYCAEVKQYSGDAMIAVVLLLLATGQASAHARFLRTAAVAAAAIWFSHTSIFIFAAVSLALAMPCARARHGWGLWILGNAAVAGSLAVLYFLSIRLEHNPYLYAFWGKDFPDLHRPLKLPGWLAAHVYELFDNPYRHFGIIEVPLALLGIIGLRKSRQRELLTFALGPVLLALLASFARQYPFNGSRLTMFLFPGLFLLMAAGVELLREMLPGRWAVAGWLLPLPAIAVGAANQIPRMARPHFQSHIRPAVEYVRAHRQPGDALYCIGRGQGPDGGGSEDRHLELFCYWRFPDPPVYTTWTPAARIPERRFWLVFPFSPGHDDRFIKAVLEDARSSATERASFVDPRGGAAYLFEK